MKRRDLCVLTTVLACCLGVACSRTPDRTRFATPDDAAKALLTGFKTNNTAELTAMFGATAEQDFTQGDPAADKRDREVIAMAMEQSWRWAPLGTDRQELVIGDEQWPFPIPLMKAGSAWQFDTDAGREEVLSRRVGRNELKAIDLCRAYVLMQEEYASRPRDGKVAGLYAQRLRSAPYRQDGLYWEAGPEERQSPLGDLVAQASAEGFDETKPSNPYWGYMFRVLTAQGPVAPGGAKDYIVNGGMSGGFALVAYPAEYGRSGVMTFIVNRDGVVHEADLGKDTAKVASALTVYNPDGAWTAVR